MATRNWTNGSGVALSAANLNSLETDLAAKADGNHTHSSATSSAAGFLSAADKAIFDAATGSPTGSTLAKRYSDGRLGVSTPTGGTDAANKGYVDARADIIAGDGRAYRVVAGVIRNDGAPNYWQLIGNGHSPINIDSIETWSDKIRVNYANVATTEIITFIAAPDESLARQGYTCGTSVTSWYTDIYLYQASPLVSDYVYYDGTTWKSQNGVFTGMTFSGGILTVNHAPVPTGSVYNVNLTPRGGGYVYAVGRGSSPTTETSLKVDIRDMTGASVTTPTTDMTFYISRGGGVGTPAPKDVDTIAIPYSNIWFYGVMGIGW